MKTRQTLLALAATAVVTVALSSCKLFTDERCWKVNHKISSKGSVETRSFYYWGSAFEVAAECTDSEERIKEELGDSTVIVSERIAQHDFETKQDCEAQNH